VNRIDQVFADPQVQHLGIARKVHHKRRGDIALVGQPVTLERTPSRMESPAPDLGEHTEQTLATLGYERDEIESLRRRQVV
jgi:formyl-CoA transferase